MIVQLLWVTSDSEAFEKSVPLIWHGEHLHRNGWLNTITLCFLQGIELLSIEYLATLRCLGYEIVDGKRYVIDEIKRYPRILELSITSRYWLLRWNVLYAIAQERNASFVIHLDADVVILDDLRKISNDVSGKTFMLQGCPAFTVINDFTWFEIWLDELEEMLMNRPAYIAKAVVEKKAPRCADRDFCNICAYGPKSFEDQGMLEYLIAAGKLPQARTSDVFESDYYWIQNPLLPGEWHKEQVSLAPQRVWECDGYTLIGSKRLAFYHFQTDFAKYSLAWCRLASFGLQSHASLINPVGVYRNKLILIKLVGKVFNWVKGPVNRQDAYNKSFSLNKLTGNRYITDIVNSCWD